MQCIPFVQAAMKISLMYVLTAVLLCKKMFEYYITDDSVDMSTKCNFTGTQEHARNKYHQMD
jgi:hypothetical protein